MAEVKAQEQRLSQAEERVKAYLEEQIEHDEALRALYAPSKIKECFQYITAEARKKASSNSYFADDAEVWKWARDYFIEELPKKAEKIPPEVAAKKDSAIPEQAESKVGEPDSEETKNTDEYGFEVFEDETDVQAETAAETEQTTEADPVTETEQATEQAESEDNENAGTPSEEDVQDENSNNEPLYDADGNGLLFAF